MKRGRKNGIRRTGAYDGIYQREKEWGVVVAALLGIYPEWPTRRGLQSSTKAGVNSGVQRMKTYYRWR